MLMQFICVRIQYCNVWVAILYIISHKFRQSLDSCYSILEGNKLIFGGLTFYEMRCKPTIIHTKHVLRYWVVPQLCVLICCIVQQFPSYCMSEKVPNWLKCSMKFLDKCSKALLWNLLFSQFSWHFIALDTNLDLGTYAYGSYLAKLTYIVAIIVLHQFTLDLFFHVCWYWQDIARK